jgi:hypothetical protein
MFAGPGRTGVLSSAFDDTIELSNRTSPGHTASSDGGLVNDSYSTTTVAGPTIANNSGVALGIANQGTLDGDSSTTLVPATNTTCGVNIIIKNLFLCNYFYTLVNH